MQLNPSIDHIVHKKDFPLDVFPPEIAVSFRDLAHARDIPIQFLGTTALFTVAALSGNIYKTVIDDVTKPVLYAMLVAPSGVGKSPAYAALCEEIILPHEITLYQQYQKDLKEFVQAKEKAKIDKIPFEQDPPRQIIRMTKTGTRKAFKRNACIAMLDSASTMMKVKQCYPGPIAIKRQTHQLIFLTHYGTDRQTGNFAPMMSGRYSFTTPVSASYLACRKIIYMNTLLRQIFPAGFLPGFSLPHRTISL